ncbi:MAG TPA: molybdenum cofactor guanylyltransferase [Longimicrobiales bacterium]|nr:molybdenum cofactor guanylyltransferase [Longimicrobiales bacterium]
MSAPIHGLPLGGVLVGGRSSRFGSDKAAAMVGGRSMAARAVDTLRAVADPVVLLGGDGALGRRLALPWRADDRSGRGPLSGLATGLRWAGELGLRGLFVLACDLPLVTREVVDAVAAQIRPDLDAVVVAAGEPAGVQPLCGWYATGTLAAVEIALDRGRHSARELLSGLRIALVRVDGTTPERRLALLNVNTRDDLAEAIRYASTEHPS